jgi:hypothetical protein
VRAGDGDFFGGKDKGLVHPTEASQALLLLLLLLLLAEVQRR